MYYITESKKSFEQASADLEEAVKRHGFGVLHVHDIGNTLRSKGVPFEQQVRVFEVCNPMQAAKEPLAKSTMSRVAGKIAMIARSVTKVVVILRCRGARHSERAIWPQPSRALALWAVCGVRLLAKGITIRVVAFLAHHPAKPSARPCGT